MTTGAIGAGPIGAGPLFLESGGAIVSTLAAAATESTAATGALLNWATVVLSGTLYSGAGGLLDPAIRYPNRAPYAGDTIYFDPTHLTVLPDGELVGAISDFAAIVQFNDGIAMQQLAIVFTSGFLGHAAEAQVAIGALSTQIIMAATASEATAAASSLTNGLAATLQGAASEAIAAVAALKTAKVIAGSGIEVTVSAGSLNALITFASTASELTSATGRFSIGSPLSAAATEVVTARSHLASFFPRLAPFRILRLPPPTAAPGIVIAASTTVH